MSPSCLTSGTRGAAMACSGALQMAFTSSAASARSGHSKMYSAQAALLHRKRIASSLRVPSRRRPTIGTRLAQWGSSVAGPTASMRSAAFVAGGSSARSSARRRPRRAMSPTSQLTVGAQRPLSACWRAQRSERMRRSAPRLPWILPRRRCPCLAQGARCSALASWPSRHGWWHGRSLRGDAGLPLRLASEVLLVCENGETIMAVVMNGSFVRRGRWRLTRPFPGPGLEHSPALATEVLACACLHASCTIRGRADVVRRCALPHAIMAQVHATETYRF
mmetsp:Transcript_136333/g.345233  ORF Transcript_136333/g.345233 Transcript_136333/m.345233 type:complete len:278 (+) Transcript_136333:1955-2788(+)